MKLSPQLSSKKTFPKTLLNGRYQLLELLGHGGLGLTYKAKDFQKKQIVAIKVLSLKSAEDWKKIELFERETKILAQLQHPNIPDYIDYFQIDSEQDRKFYLVQQLAPGRSLDKWIDSGWKPSETDVKKISIKLLNILTYLQSLNPPVIHRDIKPQNIIMDQQGQLFLVDFGSVQATFRQTVTQGSTVVGTFGYMAPEQFRGMAVPSTDLYGLATTLLFLLIGESPAILPQKKLHLQFKTALPKLNKHLANWLEHLLEPRAEHRIQTAEAALNILKGQQKMPPLAIPSIKPTGSLIKINKEPDMLTINIPHLVFSTPQIQRLAIANLVGNGFLGFVVAMIVTLQLFLDPTKKIIFFIFIAIGLFLLVKYAYGAFRVTRLVVVREQQKEVSTSLKIDQWLLGSRYLHRKLHNAQGKVVKVKQERLWPWFKTPFTYCVLKNKRQTIKFGGFLTKAENTWLAQELNNFLK